MDYELNIFEFHSSCLPSRFMHSILSRLTACLVFTFGHTNLVLVLGTFSKISWPRGPGIGHS
jgi:preprotein translocase subunit SecG